MGAPEAVRGGSPGASGPNPYAPAPSANSFSVSTSGGAGARPYPVSYSPSAYAPMGQMNPPPMPPAGYRPAPGPMAAPAQGAAAYPQAQYASLSPAFAPAPEPAPNGSALPNRARAGFAPAPGFGAPLGSVPPSPNPSRAGAEALARALGDASAPLRPPVAQMPGAVAPRSERRVLQRPADLRPGFAPQGQAGSNPYSLVGQSPFAAPFPAAPGPEVGWTKLNQFQIDQAAPLPCPEFGAKSAIIVDLKTQQALCSKNADDVRSIASISKLMAAVVLAEADQPMDEKIPVTKDDVDFIKGSSSRLSVGAALTREQLFHIGLMSSENRAIHALSRNYPGGLPKMILAMNVKAHMLGMDSSIFYDPTGLDARNKSTAADLVKLVDYASNFPAIRRFTTSLSDNVNVLGRSLHYSNSNKVVREGAYDVSLQKTGYIREAGRCMVVAAEIAGNPYAVVILNSPTTMTRYSDFVAANDWIVSNAKALRKIQQQASL